MVERLADMLPLFPGTPNHTWCFLHTVNLVTKSLIREFDMTKKYTNWALEEDSEFEPEVSENRQCAPLQLTFQNLAAQACLQTHSLDYRTPPHMAQSAACIWPVHHQYAMGCRYPVEFDLQHVEICAGPSGCNRHCNAKSRLRFAQVWTHQCWIGDSAAALWCAKGICLHMFIIQLTKVNIIDSQRCNYILLSLHAKLGHCDSCHGFNPWDTHKLFLQPEISHLYSCGCASCQENSEPLLWAHW